MAAVFHAVKPSPQLLQCEPQYIPDAGHEDIDKHSADPTKVFYGMYCSLWQGVVSSRESRDMVLRAYGAVSVIEAATWPELKRRWYQECVEHHVHEESTGSITPSESSLSTASTLSKFSSWASISTRASSPTTDDDAVSALLQRQRQKNRSACEAYAAEEADLRQQHADALDSEIDTFFTFRRDVGASARNSSTNTTAPIRATSPTKAVKLASKPTSSPTKGMARNLASSPTKAAASKLVSSPTKAPAPKSTSSPIKAVVPKSPTKGSLGFAPPYRPGDAIGPTPLLPSAADARRGRHNTLHGKNDMPLLEAVSDSSDEGDMPQLEATSNASDDDGETVWSGTAPLFALNHASRTQLPNQELQERSARGDIQVELAELFKRTDARSWAEYQRKISRQVLLYAVSGHNTIFQDRERAMVVLRESPGADLLFTFDEAAILAFIDTEAARMAASKEV